MLRLNDAQRLEQLCYKELRITFRRVECTSKHTIIFEFLSITFLTILRCIYSNYVSIILLEPEACGVWLSSKFGPTTKIFILMSFIVRTTTITEEKILKKKSHLDATAMGGCMTMYVCGKYVSFLHYFVYASHQF